ncbi:hypothetical protein D7X33_21085 [Butyricicoccus sp. 1XD8-22]|nr:hypothetical protein D7X33_21085 [Butyricicoccus sp. 1XD8-22]
MILLAVSTAIEIGLDSIAPNKVLCIQQFLYFVALEYKNIMKRRESLMKDTIVNFGQVILGVLIVVAVFLGLFLTFSTDGMNETDERLDTAQSKYESVEMTNPYTP